MLQGDAACIGHAVDEANTQFRFFRRLEFAWLGVLDQAGIDITLMPVGVDIGIRETGEYLTRTVRRRCFEQCPQIHGDRTLHVIGGGGRAKIPGVLRPAARNVEDEWGARTIRLTSTQDARYIGLPLVGAHGTMML